MQLVAATALAELPPPFKVIKESTSEAVLIQTDPMLSAAEWPRILGFTAAQRLPAITEGKLGVARGALLSHGTDTFDTAGLAAGYGPPAAHKCASDIWPDV